MPSILSKNCVSAVVTGFYCLVCFEHFLHEVKAFEHLSKEKHKAALRAIDCYEELKKDFIIQIKSMCLYYCKLCDRSFTTISKVKLHVSKDQHLLKKQNEAKLIKRQDNNIVVFEEVLLTSDAWNGVIDDTCLLCNVEFEEPAHINEEEHVYNRMRSTILVDGSLVHRRIGDTLQCLTCNEIVTDDALETHVNSTAHENSYKTSQDEMNDKKIIKDITVNEKSKGTNDKATLKPADKSNESDLVIIFDKYREQKINVNLITKTVFCKICLTDIEFNKEGIEEHIKKHNSTNDDSSVHKKPVNKPDNGSNIQGNGKYAIANQHGLMQYKDQFYCKPCHCFIPSAMKNLMIHISSNEHETKTIELRNRPKVLDEDSKVSFKELIEEGAVRFRISGEKEMEPHILFRDKYIMLLGTFLGITMYARRHMVCDLCEVPLGLIDNVSDHVASEEHIYHMNYCQLITAVEGEVIRQITNGRYQCGYCCVVENDWDDMLLHITTDDHYCQKISIKLVLDEYKANYQKCEFDVKFHIKCELSSMY